LRNEWFRAQEATSSRNSKLNSGSTELFKKQTPEILAEAIERLGKAFFAMQTDMRVRSEALWAMQKSVIQKLEVGKLEAYGVQSAPNQRRNLEVLPKHFFMDAKINWAENQVTNFGVTYGSVRVRRRSSATPQASIEKLLNAAISSSAVAAPPVQKTAEAHDTPADDQTRAVASSTQHESGEARPQKPGPPSGAGEVIATFDQLFERGLLSEGMTMKEIHNKLLPHLKRNSKIFPNGRGLACSSIARHLSPHLRSKFSS